MKVVFLGTGEIGIPSLRLLACKCEVFCVVTQPDRPAGRSLRPTPPPIKTAALELGLPILQPSKIRDAEAVDALRRMQAELFVVAAYGQILPRRVLEIPPRGTINIHASLLPRHRGASPIQAAILAGDSQSGITIMWVDEGLDTGDILLQRACPILPEDTGGSLHDRLAELTPMALAEALEAIADGTAPRQPQDSSLATYAPRLTRADGRLDFREDAHLLERKIRAFQPFPGAWAEPPDGQPLKIHRAAACLNMEPVEEGAVHIEGPRYFIGCGSGALELLEVQAAGSRRMTAAEFFRGHPAPARFS